VPADLDTAADELYGGTREDFTARRKELAKEARNAGDQRLAADIDKLAKPTTSAWIANQLARDSSSDVDQIASLGEALREAHTNLKGADLRSLGQQRTKLVNTLIRQAGKHGNLTEAVTRELEDIFTTAIVNPDVARVVLAGRLASAKDLLAAAAEWPSADGAAAAVAPRPAARKAREKPARTDREREELEKKRAAAQKDLDDARSAVKEAEADRKEEERILEEAQRAADEATEHVRRVYEELDAAETAEKDARRRVGSASRSVKDAERRAGQAWRLVQQAEEKLADLGK
jgi:DNA repair exonuclease SbcCD ATPase subunit